MRHSFIHSYIAFALCIQCICAAFAQDELTYKKLHFATVPSIQDMELVINEDRHEKITLIESYRSSSAMGEHIQFQAAIDSISVYGAMCKLFVAKSGKSILTYAELPDKTERSHFPEREVLHEWMADRQILKSGAKSSKEWVLVDGVLSVFTKITYRQGMDLIEVLIDGQGKELSERSLVFNNKTDSSVNVNIYNPDPVTAAETSYGGDFTDNNDINNINLDLALSSANINLRFDSVNKRWELHSDHCLAADISAPFIAPPTSSDGSFVFTREQSGFEYVNAYYHINTLQQQLSAMGLTNLANYPMPMDAHGKDGADQSSFYPENENTGQGHIEFGDGGVDDAEDADVIIHEYAHGLIYSAAPGTAFGSERLALEEGVCDFFAWSYSDRISKYDRSKLFNWDGHNEFWSGREISSTLSYPSDVNSDIYSTGLIWTSALSDVSDLLGNEIAEELMYNSMFNFYPYMQMNDAARLYMQADSLMYDAQHSAYLNAVFCSRGLILGCEDTLISTKPLNEPYLGGTEDFTLRDGTIFVYPNKTRLSEITVHSLTGELVTSILPNPLLNVIYPLQLNDLDRGIYVLTLVTNSGTYSFKIIKAT